MASQPVNSAAKGGGRADADCFVGEAHRQRVAVGLRVGDYSLYTKLMAGADDAHGDFAPVSD
jgi:hypothetical protein